MNAWPVIMGMLSLFVFIASVMLFTRVRFQRASDAVMHITAAFADFWLLFGIMHLFSAAQAFFSYGGGTRLGEIFGQLVLACFAALTILIFRSLLRLYGKPSLERLAVGTFEVVTAFFVYFMLTGGVKMVSLYDTSMVELRSLTALMLLNWSLALPAFLAALSNVGYSLYIVGYRSLPFRYRQLMVSMAMLVVYAMTYMAVLGLGGNQLAIAYIVTLVAIGFGYLGFAPPRRMAEKLGEEEAIASADRLLRAWEEERQEER